MPLNSIYKFRSLAIALLGSLGLGDAHAYDKVVDDFFNSTDPFVRDTVLPNIEKYRKSDAKIALTDEAGKPMVGANVSVIQFEQSFLWGDNPPNEDPLWGTSDIFKLWRAVYNYGIAENVFKWDSIEKAKGSPDFSRADKLLEVIKSSGAQIELHFLVGYDPVWLFALPDGEKANLQRAHALAMLEHYRDKIKYYQVYNEVTYQGQKRGNASVYFDLTQFFAEIAQKYPDLHLGINDCWPWDLMSKGQALPSPAFLKKTYPGIAFLGMHGHKPHNYYVTPQEIYRMFDPFVGSGVKTQICEFGITTEPITGNATGTWTDELRAKYFVSIYATVFSHPAFEAFNQWGIGPRVNRWTANPMIDGDGNPRPSYYAIKSLVKDKFMTKAEGKTDSTGQFAYRGFRGRYEIKVEREGQEATAEITLGDTDAFYALQLAPSAEGLRLEGGDRVTHCTLNSDKGSDTKVNNAGFVMPAGQPVVFAGLATIKHWEILDAREQIVRVWDMIGDRIEWDANDARGQQLKPGKYAVHATTAEGETITRTLSVR